MRLFTNEKEAELLQKALIAYASANLENATAAGILYARISICLDLQCKEKAATPKDNG